MLGCQHCIDCESCQGSSYLVRSISLSRSSYCFGCVGLTNKDFHILNQPHSRQDYFAITKRLVRELGI